MKASIALLLTTIFLLCIAAEVTVRVLQHYEVLPDYRKGQLQQSLSEQQHVRAPKYRNSNDKRLFIEHDTSQAGINRWGTRDPDFQQEKLPETYRIAVIGDSVSFGYGLTYEQSYPFQLQSILRTALPHENSSSHIEVLNFAVSGYGLEAYQALYDTKVKQFKPDLVLIGYVQNDIAPTSTMVQSVADSMKSTGLRKKIARYSQFAAWLYEQIGKVRGKLAFNTELRAYQHDEAIANSVTQLHKLQNSIATDNTDSAILLFPYFISFDKYPLNKVHNTLTQALAQNDHIVCDLLPAFAIQPADTWRLAPSDYVHPNAQGAELAARAAYNCLHQYARLSIPTISTITPAK